MDADGYPDGEELARIVRWPHTDLVGLFQFIRTLWQYKNCWKQRGRRYWLSTGGWSGNESLIEALQSNQIVWLVCFYSHRRGGHYVFELPKIKKKTA